VSSTDFHATNRVDVNWTVTVIKKTSTTIKVVNDTAYSSASTPSCLLMPKINQPINRSINQSINHLFEFVSQRLN